MAFRFSTISIKALLIAMAVTALASGIFGFLFIFIISVSHGIKDAAEFHALVSPTVTLIVAVAFNVIVGVGMGYLAAFLAKRAEMLHGVLSSLFFVATGIYAVASGVAPEYQMRNIVFTILAPLFGLLGGWLRWRQVRAAQ